MSEKKRSRNQWTYNPETHVQKLLTPEGRTWSINLQEVFKDINLDEIDQTSLQLLLYGVKQYVIDTYARVKGEKIDEELLLIHLQKVGSGIIERTWKFDQRGTKVTTDDKVARVLDKNLEANEKLTEHQKEIIRQVREMQKSGVLSFEVA